MLGRGVLATNVYLVRSGEGWVLVDAGWSARDAAVIRAAAAAGLAAAFPVGNAGLLHVYGYWFSDEPTPYGFKRDRWVDGALAGALTGDDSDERLRNAAIGAAAGGVLDRVVQFVSVPEHFRRDFTRGLVDTRAVVLYLSVTAFCLFLTVRSLEARRLRA